MGGFGRSISISTPGRAKLAFVFTQRAHSGTQGSSSSVQEQQLDNLLSGKIGFAGKVTHIGRAFQIDLIEPLFRRRGDVAFEAVAVAFVHQKLIIVHREDFVMAAYLSLLADPSSSN